MDLIIPQQRIHFHKHRWTSEHCTNSDTGTGRSNAVAALEEHQSCPQEQGQHNREVKIA